MVDISWLLREIVSAVPDGPAKEQNPITIRPNVNAMSAKAHFILDLS